MKRKLLFFSLLFTLLLVLTGCGNKSVISTSKFRSIVESNGYMVADDMNDYSSFSYINEAVIATKGDYFIQFFVLENSEKANSMFMTNKNKFESSKYGVSAEVSTSLGNYETYELQTNGYYKYISRVDNTILYINVNEKYKVDVKKVIDAMNY